MRGDKYQIVLIGLGIVATMLFGAFFYRELFPEYRIYQKNYEALEEFRSEYTGVPPAPFKQGIKQIVFHREDRGPTEIARCTSCHLALKLPHFSPTKLARDINGQLILSPEGIPEQEPNEEYIWAKLQQEIETLVDPKVLSQLEKEGESGEVRRRKARAETLRSLKTAHVGEHVWDVTKVLRMHPLIGAETRPFEFHPIEEYGCISCHGGNGRALTTLRAHGPVFDGQYEAEFMGEEPQFLETDTLNDPQISKVFNDKPGGKLLFQTTPILVGGLLEAKCVQCHQSQEASWQRAVEQTATLRQKFLEKAERAGEAFQREVEALLVLLWVDQLGVEGAQKELEELAQEERMPQLEKERITTQLHAVRGLNNEQIAKQLQKILGSQKLVSLLQDKWKSDPEMGPEQLEGWLRTQQGAGTLFAKEAEAKLQSDLKQHILDTEGSLEQVAGDSAVMSRIVSDVDRLTTHYRRGQELFLTQACYTCHKVAGLSRGGVGPELTDAGDDYPWALKEAIVWPQGDLPTSTMPNYRLDHEEVEDLLTFLLGQKGENQAVSPVDSKLSIQKWEEGQKLPWEKPLPPAQVHDLKNSMTIFATEGCAACHRLQGFDSTVGFANQDQLYEERAWFRRLFPEQVLGSNIVQQIEKHKEEIDAKIVDGVRKEGLLEEIEKKAPGQIFTLYTPFKFARRARDHQLQDKPEELAAWKERVERVLKMFIQEYGLGRQIGPKTSWSGIYRSDQWLMEHFRKPTELIPRSIMPVFPFDTSKFYALTYMLDELGVRNRNQLRAEREEHGFNPEQVFQIHCAQCHGDFRQGDGPVADWIYPVPKNLRNADFMRNLTRDKAVYAIKHGVKGTPMSPWGEVAVDKPTADGVPVLTEKEIEKLVDWLFASLPGESVIQKKEDVPKWQYTPEDVLKELKREREVSGEQPVAYASLASMPPPVLGVPNLFTTREKPTEDGEKKQYYLKETYYTPENLIAGQSFFQMNCAVCHGAEADGAGVRSGVMLDAKPRMLTNLDWLDTRDDLRLLRSIKYGVAGTAMIPWGDATSALQRIQLVTYIRSLSAETNRRKELTDLLYRVYDVPVSAVRRARIKGSERLQELEGKLLSNRLERQNKERTAEGKSDEAVALYRQELALVQEIAQERKRDQQLIALSDLLGEQREAYHTLGRSFLQRLASPSLFSDYLQLVSESGTAFETSPDGRLEQKTEKTKFESLVKEVVAQLEENIADLSKRETLLKERASFPEREEELEDISREIEGYRSLRSKLLTVAAERQQWKEQEDSLYKELQNDTL